MVICAYVGWRIDNSKNKGCNKSPNGVALFRREIRSFDFYQLE